MTREQKHIDYRRDAAKESDAVLFVNGKIKFVRPDGTIGKWPSNGTTLFAFGSRAVDALRDAEINGLGVLLELP